MPASWPGRSPRSCPPGPERPRMIGARRRLGDVARADVRRAPLDDARDEAVGAGDRRDPRLDQPVAEGHERAHNPAADEPGEHRLEIGRLEGQQREVERAPQVRHVGDGRNRHNGRRAELVQPQPRRRQPRDVLPVRVQRCHVMPGPGEAWLRRLPRSRPRRPRGPARRPATPARPDHRGQGNSVVSCAWVWLRGRKGC